MTKLTPEQRNAVMSTLADDMLTSMRCDDNYFESFVKETLFFGRQGFDSYEDHELLELANDWDIDLSFLEEIK